MQRLARSHLGQPLRQKAPLRIGWRELQRPAIVRCRILRAPEPPQEVRARGGHVIAVVDTGDTQIRELADDVVVVPRAPTFIAPIIATVPLQLLAYHVADLRGTDVDQPRNLAKSVTVE